MPKIPVDNSPSIQLSATRSRYGVRGIGLPEDNPGQLARCSVGGRRNNICQHRATSLQQFAILLPLRLRRGGVPPVLRHSPPDALDSFGRLRSRAQSTMQPAASVSHHQTLPEYPTPAPPPPPPPHPPS